LLDSFAHAFDLPGDVLGGFGAAAGEFLDFVGDDGEAEAVFAGAGGFDGGVEGKQIGLAGDAIDQGDDALKSG